MAARFGSLDVPTESFAGLSFAGDESSESTVKFAPKKYGIMGQKVQLKVNFFKINLSPNTPNYFHYNIEILNDDSTAAGPSKGGRKGKQQQQQQPKKDGTPKSKKTPKRLNDEIFREVFRKYSNVFQCSFLPVFDGEKNFYSINQFNLPNGNNWSGKVTVKDKDRDQSFIVNITVPEVSHGQTLKNLKQSDKKVMPIELQALDIIMRNGPRLCKISLGPNFFFKSDDDRARKYQFDIGKDIMKYGQFGIYQNAKKTEGNQLYYNVDRAMAVFTDGGELIKKVDEICAKSNRFGPREKSELEDYIKGLKFRALHLNYNRTFIIAGLSKDTIGRTMFNFEKDGQKRQISVLDYFKSEHAQFYNRHKFDESLPCVQVGSRQNAKYFPIETCYLEKDEVYRRKLRPDLQGMVTRKSSQQTPIDRFQAIESNIQGIRDDNTIKYGNKTIDYLKEFGIQIDNKASLVDGRILGAPKIEYKDNKIMDTGGNGSWEMRGVQFYQPSNIGGDWAVVNFERIYGRENRSSPYRRKIEDLIKALISDARHKGINLSMPCQTIFDFNYSGRGTLERELFQKLNKNLKLVIILIPNNDEIYHEIKTVAELNRGLITQCLNQTQKYWRDDRWSPQLITNFFLKINPKCSGTNQNIEIKSRPPFLRTKMMIIGLDVTHPSPTDGLSKSIAGVVASYTKEFDKCFHRIVVQEKGRKELVSLRKIVKELLEKFAKVNKGYPAKILVYRDGIGEGDFEKVINCELNGMKQACEELNADIKFTYIMVQKRHNTRFIPTTARSTDKRQNVQPGTIVDSKITHHSLYEFYLCSHAGMMGTSRPCKYVVLVDENDVNADELQASTYYLCYLYPRCTKSSSIPPHVAYAHLICARARSYLSHLDNSDAQSSASSSGGKLPVLSASDIENYNKKLMVKDKINGILFFI